MQVTRTAPAAFTIKFESEEEVRQEHAANFVVGGLRLPTDDPPSLHSSVDVTLCGPGGATVPLRAAVVAPLPDGVALAFAANGDELLDQLLAGSAEQAPPDVDGGAEPAAAEKSQPLMERIREMPRVQKIIFATKADRTERAILLQDNDPQVLTSLLKNPRITIDEVVRVAKSPFLSYQPAELIMKTSQFMASVDVRVALIHNPKTPQPFALRILPTLPDSEVKNIARGAATSMALKQAALKRLQGGK